MFQLKIFRANDWWQSKAALLMGIVYIAVAWFSIGFNSFIFLSLSSIATIAGFASVGYLVNDFFDREKDARAGKKNFLHNKSPALIALLLLLASVLLFAPWLYLPFTRYSVFFIAAELALFVLYSLPPVRLKERAWAGVVADAGYAHALPVLLAVYTFSLAAGKTIPVVAITLLLVWQMLNGIRNILLHQFDDMEADLRVGSKNLVAGMATNTFYFLLLALVTIEIIASCLFFSSLAVNMPYFIACMVLLLFWAIAIMAKFYNTGFHEIAKTHWRYFPNNVYEKWLPPLVLAILSLSDWRFLVVLLVHIFLFNTLLYTETYKVVFPAIRDMWTKHIRVSLRSIASALINYPIYFLFLLFGVDLKKENRSAADYIKSRKKKT